MKYESVKKRSQSPHSGLRIRYSVAAWIQLLALRGLNPLIRVFGFDAGGWRRNCRDRSRLNPLIRVFGFDPAGPCIKFTHFLCLNPLIRVFGFDRNFEEDNNAEPRRLNPLIRVFGFDEMKISVAARNDESQSPHSGLRIRSGDGLPALMRQATKVSIPSFGSSDSIGEGRADMSRAIYRSQSPHSGLRIRFLGACMESEDQLYVSIPSFGSSDSINGTVWNPAATIDQSQSPHSGLRIRFFMEERETTTLAMVSIPSFGSSDSILIGALITTRSCESSLNPLIRVFGFDPGMLLEYNTTDDRVSIPSFGSSDSIRATCRNPGLPGYQSQSPHSGLRIRCSVRL